MFEKLRWMIRFWKSRTYVVLLDREAVVSIPLTSVDSFENQFLLSAQTASLMEFKGRLEDVIREHEQAIQLLSHRQSVKQKAKKEARNSNNVQKTTKAK